MSDSQQMIGIIGGSGLYQMDSVEIVKEHLIETPFGKPSSCVIEAKIENHKFYFLPRHGKAHHLNPSEVNYRANIFALKQLGVELILSVSAVGSLKEEMPPTSFVLVDQFIDWTKGLRKRSFFENGVVAHVSNANPIHKSMQNELGNACEKLGLDYHKNGTYICIEGPQFSTRAESALYKSMGASVIGMTNVPESFLAKEAGLAYATVAMVTDYDAWKDEHCTVEEIMKVMKTNNMNAQKLIKEFVTSMGQKKLEIIKENAIGVMTPKDKWAKDQISAFETLLS